MVASTHWLASATGMAILEQGGNAFDAAVAAGFVLQVVEPHLNGPGGEVPIVLAPAGSDEVHVVCGQGVAPAAATIARFRELGLDLVPGTGLLAACVPGAFSGWLLLLREFGTLPLAEVLEPAIGYAERGYPVVPRISQSIEGMAQLFRDEWPTSAKVYLPAPHPGTLHRNPRLAETYRRLVAEAERSSGDRGEQIDAAERGFYEGFVAEAIVAFLERTEAMDSSGRRHRGLLAGDDLAYWRASLEASVALDYGRFRVHKPGPWSQGPVLLQQLQLLAGLDLERMGAGSAELVHAVVEGAKLAFADREAWYGDPDAFDVPLDSLLSPAYAVARRALVGDSASAELRPGMPGGREPRLPPLVVATAPEAPGLGEPTRGDTCHVDVVDRHGNLVSATPSGGWLHGSPVIPELGFCLGTRAQMFWLTEELASSLVPGRRPRTTLSPSLAFRDGEPYLAFGTPGGDQQDQWSLAVFLGHADFGLDLQEAIDAASWHMNHFPASFYPREWRPRDVEVESRIGGSVLDELRRRGHEVTVAPEWSLGRVSAVAREPGGVLKAAADPRGAQGYAVGR
jgi:gamma-glutamyltranspeptidase / glutathione hydrolase